MQPSSGPGRYVWLAGVLVLVGGAVTLTGWLFGITALTRVDSTYVMMKANAALGFVLLGVCLALLPGARPASLRARVVQGCALVVGAIGLFTVFEYASGVSLGIDELVVHDVYVPAQTSSPGRMSINTTVCFALLGAALALLTSRSRWYRLAQGLAAAAVVIALSAVVGYVYGVHALFRVGAATSIAPQTAVLLLVASSAVLASHPREGLLAVLTRGGMGTRVFRRQLVPLVLAVLVLGWLRLLGQRHQLYAMETGTLLYGITLVVIFLGASWRSALSLNALDLARNETEERLRHSEERLGTALENMKAGMVIAREGGRLVYWNPSARHTHGLEDARDGEGKVADFAHVFELWTADGARKLELSEWPMYRIARGEELHEVELRLRRLDQGWERRMRYSGARVRTAEGEGLIYLSMDDVTEQRRAEEELRRAVRARDDFLSIASHELKTPLSSLKLQAQLLARNIARGVPDACAPEKVARMVQQTDRQVSRLVRLVDDMLDVSRIESGRLAIHADPFVFGDMVREVVDRLRPEMVGAGTEPVFELVERIEGAWDRFRLEQVVTNLLTNAMRYGERRPVTIRVERVGLERLRMTVRDLGRGICPADQRRIFDRFERAVSSNEVSGLGLGLFISREIVARHGGEMWVNSAPGAGATFHVELPTGRVARPAASEAA